MSVLRHSTGGSPFLSRHTTTGREHASHQHHRFRLVQFCDGQFCDGQSYFGRLREHEGGTTRRAILRTAAWATPAITLAGVAPVYAASQNPSTQTPLCPTVGWEAALYGGIQFAGLNAWQEWRSSNLSSATLRLRIGRLLGDAVNSANDPALGFQSNTSGLTVTLQQYSFEVTLPYRVTFTTVPSGWSVTHVSGTRYRFTPTASIVATSVNPHTSSPDGTGPGVAIPASGVFEATIPGGNFSSGQQVKNATYNFSPHYNAVYTVTGSNCAPRIGTAAWDSTIAVRPV